MLLRVVTHKWHCSDTLPKNRRRALSDVIRQPPIERGDGRKSALRFDDKAIAEIASRLQLQATTQLFNDYTPTHWTSRRCRHTMQPWKL